MELVTKLGELVTWATRLSRRMLNRFNIEYRAHKFIDKGHRSLAPRHPTHEKLISEILQKKPELKEELKELHEKDELLNEFLKKVYLTSTSELTGTESKRPKLNKYLKPLDKMFYEPEKPMEGRCNYTNVLEILTKFQTDNNYWNASALARHYNLEKKHVADLVMYYSLFTNEKFQFMNQEAKDPHPEDKKEKIQFQVLANPEQDEPPKQIEQKKE